MFNSVKTWWLKRSAKHYVKNHWHLFVDIILVLIILFLVITFVVVKQQSKQEVDTTPVEHVAKNLVSTTTKSLKVSEVFSRTNIYSGKSFNLHLILKNEGTQDISNLVLTPNFSSNNFFISSLENETASSSIKINNHKLLLEKINPGETIEADLSLVINAKNKTPRYIDWSLKSTYDENNKAYVDNYSLERLKLVTDLKVGATAYYHSVLGDQLGSGPVPPVVGLPTNYWLFLEIENQGNDLSGVVVNAKLPEAVTLSGRKTLSAGDFSYDEGQKRITWTIKKAVVDNGRYQIGFEVQLLPLASQFNLEPLLLTNISYLATDSYTGEKLNGKLANINTDLPLDVINQGQGKVIK